MGCTASSSGGFEAIFTSNEFKSTVNELEPLKLTATDIQKLYYVFDEILSAGEKSITRGEFLKFANLVPTAFLVKALSILNANKSGELGFKDFVICVWNYCTLTKHNMDMFTFDLYDKTGTRPLLPAEVLCIFQDIHGEEEMKTNPQAQRCSTELYSLSERKKTFNTERFRVFMMHHQAALLPAFQLQLALQTKICGAAFWQEQTAKRAALSSELYVSVAQLMDPGKIGLNSTKDVSTKAVSVKKDATPVKKDASPPSWKEKVSASKVYVDVHTGGMMFHESPGAAVSHKRMGSSHDLLHSSIKSNGDLLASSRSNTQGAGTDSVVTESYTSGRGSPTLEPLPPRSPSPGAGMFSPYDASTSPSSPSNRKMFRVKASPQQKKTSRKQYVPGDEFDS